LKTQQGLDAVLNFIRLNMGEIPQTATWPYPSMIVKNQDFVSKTTMFS
jgi:hypothetical protein